MADPASLLAARYGAAIPSPDRWGGALDVLLRHRSVRAYLPDPIPDDTLAALIAAAQSASTSSNLQVWSVIAVEDPARKDRLAAAVGNQQHVREAPLFLAWLIDLARLKNLADTRGEKSEGLDYIESFLLGVVDAALAAQNAVIALESLGLGCCYIGGVRNRPVEVAAELGLPPHVFALFGMTVGKPDPARPAKVKPRLPQDAVLFRERYAWGETQQDAITAYDARLRVFQREEGMTEQDWTAQATRRIREAKSLNGRHVLRDVLHRFGFQLR